MRILILHSKYLSGPASGENRVVEDEARLLESAGHTVMLSTPSPDTQGTLSTIKSAANAIWSRQASSLVDKAVSHFNPDIVHCHNLWPSFSPSILRTLSHRNVPIVMTLHNYRLMCLPGTFLLDGKICERCLGRSTLPGVKYRCYRDSIAASAVLATSIQLHRAGHSFARVDRWLAVSQFVKDKHVEAGLPAERVAVKPNFSWPMTRRRGAGDYFLYFGRLAPEKGVDVLLTAFEGMPEQLIVVGDGPDGGRLRSIAPSNVTFRGLLAPDDIPATLAGARAVVVPSIWHEPGPRSVLEAYAAGVPVLASRMGGLSEYVTDEVSGVLIEPRNPVAWRRAVSRLGERGESERLGAGAWQQWDELYRPERAVQNLEAEYVSAIQTTHGSGIP